MAPTAISLWLVPFIIPILLLLSACAARPEYRLTSDRKPRPVGPEERGHGY